jgi:hypothetical protein
MWFMGRPKRASGWLRRRARRLALSITPVLVASAVMMLLPAAQSAFTSTTTNPNNRHTAGRISLTDNDTTDTLTLFNLSNVKPGDTTTSCIQVTSAGNLSTAVSLYGTTTGTGLNSYLDLVITRGTISSGSFGDCTNFTPDATAWTGGTAGVIYTGTLAAFPTTTVGALADPRPSTPELWSASEVHAYKFQLTVQDNNLAQGKTLTQAFTWYATSYNTYDTAVLADSPFAYYPLDETSGTAAYEAIGGLNGTHSANVTVGATGLFTNSSRAATYTGTAPSRTVLTNDNQFLLNASFSIEFWYQQNGINTSRDSLMSTGAGGSGDSSYLISVGTGIQAMYFKRGGQDQAIVSAAGVDSAAHHYVITYDEPTARLRCYRDSVQNLSKVMTAYADSTAPAHAPYLGDGDQRAIGTMDNVAFYATALTAPQVLAHYNAR